MADIQLGPIATAALACLSDAVNANPNPPLNICFRPATEIAHDLGSLSDLCCEGLAYVAVGDVWPSASSFPENDIVRQTEGFCPPPAWGVEFQLGVLRCIPALDDSGNAPTCEEETQAFLDDLNDIDALQRAACCLRAYVLNTPATWGMSVVIGRMTKNILGGCRERSIPVSVQLPNCQTCVPPTL